jgi:hypothetical protein
MGLIGRFFCRIGRPKWEAVKGTEKIERRSKFDIVELALGICKRGCGASELVSRSVDY